MFKKSDKKSQKSGKKFGITLISEDSSFRGDIHFQGCLEVQGSLKGQVVSEEPTGQVRVLSGGSVSGQISVPNVVINGAVKGDIFARRVLSWSLMPWWREIFITMILKLKKVLLYLAV